MIKRYSISECASTGMDHDSEGDYVLFDDYEDKIIDMQVDYKELESKYCKLVKALGDLYREG